MSDPSPRTDETGRPATWRPSRRTLLIVGAAFAIGLLLFIALWMGDRNTDFYRAQPSTQTVEGQQFEPLPAPLPADEADNASGMRAPAPEDAPAARVVETPPSPPRPPAPIAPPPPPAPVATGPSDAPVPIQSPAPRYPQDALRSGESGEVLLRVHVGPDGVPMDIDLVRSSHSRSLDRAATDAVRRWRFRPAQRNGQPVEGVVQIPISFNAGG